MSCIFDLLINLCIFIDMYILIFYVFYVSLIDLCMLFRQTHLLGYVENKKNTLCMYYNKNKYTIYLENKKNTICMETYGPPCIVGAKFKGYISYKA